MENFQTKRKKFIESFNLQKNGYENVTILRGIDIGFTARRKYKAIKDSEKKFFSFFRVYIKNEDLKNSDLEKKPIIISASFTYQKNEEFFVVSGNFKNKIKNPVDLISRGDYSYDIRNNEFYKGRSPIEAETILEKIYSSHIKSTKKIKGLYFRTKVFFWRRFLPFLVEIFRKVFYYSLFFISKEKYKYNLWSKFLDKEVNARTKDKTTEDSPKKTIKIFGYQTSFWPIMIYSLIHLFIYTILFVFEYKPAYLKILFTNTFLSILYVFLSLGFFEKWLPEILKFLIRYTTGLRYMFTIKEIPI